MIDFVAAGDSHSFLGHHSTIRIIATLERRGNHVDRDTPLLASEIGRLHAATDLDGEVAPALPAAVRHRLTGLGHGVATLPLSSRGRSL